MPWPDGEAVWDLLDALYAGAQDGAWSPFLVRLERMLDASPNLGVFGPSPDRPPLYTGATFLTPEDEDAYRRYYHTIDPTRPDRTGIRPGAIERFHERFDPDEFARTEIYQDFIRPKGLAPDGLAARLPIPSETGTVMLGLWLPRGREWSHDDQRLLERLLPHLRRAVTVQLRLRCFEHERTSLLGCLDHLPAAAFLLDAEGRVARTNAAAEALVASGRALRCVRGRLRCALPADERRLAQRLDEALRRAVAGDGRDVVAIQRPEGGPPLEAVVTRLAGPEAAEAGAPVVAVFVRDPLASPPAPTELLRRLYGLTRAEARLAALIGEGLAPAHAAERLGITTQTARSQLKTIFQKTQTNRQAALVRLLAGAPFRLLPAESADSPRRRG